MKNSTAQAIASVVLALVVSVAIYVTKDGAYLWGILVLAVIWQ